MTVILSARVPVPASTQKIPWSWVLRGLIRITIIECVICLPISTQPSNS